MSEYNDDQKHAIIRDWIKDMDADNLARFIVEHDKQIEALESINIQNHIDAVIKDLCTLYDKDQELEQNLESWKTLLQKSQMTNSERITKGEEVLRGLCDELLKPILLIKNIEALKEKLGKENIKTQEEP